MSEMESALYSTFVIDGVRKEYTPAQLLSAVTEHDLIPAGKTVTEPVMDETMDPPLKVTSGTEVKDSVALLGSVVGVKRIFPLAYSDSFTRMRLASAILGTLWHRGHFRLRDLNLAVSWKWNPSPVGAMAAFYESVQAAADYADALGLHFCDVACTDTRGGCEVSFKPSLEQDGIGEDDGFVLEPFRSHNPKLLPQRSCPAHFVLDTRSWVIYVPFDTADFRLGGSALAQVSGFGGASVMIEDADCFIDCFEVVREFVEDGVLLSACSVEDGGLLAALDRMAEGSCALDADISGIIRSYHGESPLRVLFAEVPGVVVQIRDADFDYVDAELLLQDVAYFPLGHPSEGRGVKVRTSGASWIQNILDSLIQYAEGED